MMRRFGTLLLCCVLPSAVLAAAPTPPPQDIPSLQRQLDKFRADAGVPGVGVALFDRNGVTWAGGLGYADVAKQQPVTVDTLFRAGSITKGFVAVALLQLVDQGKVRLDARLKDIAPEIPVDNPWEDTDPVTLAEVLEHTAGFDDMHFPRLYNFHEPADIPLLTVIQRSKSELRVRWRPGTRTSYSNPDYLIAGYLIEKFTGERYEQYVTDHVLRPLGMAQASLAPDPASVPGLAQGYEGQPQQPIRPVPIYLRPAGALDVSPTELAHFGIMLLDRGEWQNQPFLSAASVTRMETPETGGGARHGLDYGYGLANYTSYIGADEFHGHDGGIDGFISRYAYAPDQGLGFVLMVNTGSPGKFMREASGLLAGYLMRGQPTPVMPTPVPASATTLAQMSGYYRERNPRNQVLAVGDYLFGVAHVFPDGKGALRVKGLFEDSVTLLPAGEGLWRAERHSGADTVSYVDKDGDEVLDREPNASGEYLVKTSWVSAYLPTSLVFAALLLMLSSVLFAPVWGFRKLIGHMRGATHWSVRVLPLLASLALACMLGGVISIAPIELGVANARTVSFFVFSLLFAALSVAAVVQAVRSYRWDLNRWMRWHSTAVAASCFGVTLFLAYWGMIGLRLWAF
ncbi:MAG TPA: serine hydrolase domain-containing protein [Gammaproteobacteria bacterium]|nr:serine hydrolase domain-containing protein [Gammaproteobacteria bacterium]